MLFEQPHAEVNVSTCNGLVHLNTTIHRLYVVWISVGQHIQEAQQQPPKSEKNRKMFSSKKFILSHCLGSITLPRSNERDSNSRAVEMHKTKEKKRRGKEKVWSQFVLKSIRTQINSYSFLSTRTHFRSVRTHLVLVWSIRSYLVNSYSFW